MWVLLPLLLGCLWASPALGISSRELRELDTVGVVKDVRFVLGDDPVVATEQNVLARLSAGSGNLVWRVVAPSGETLQKIAVGTNQLFALSTVENRSHAALIRGLDLVSGSIMWEFILDKGDHIVGAHDLSYDQRSQTLKVLCHGGLYVIEDAERVARSWSSLPFAISAKLLQLSSNSAIAAVGCVSSDEHMCRELVAIGLSVTTRSYVVKALQPASECPVDTVGVLPNGTPFCWVISSGTASFRAFESENVQVVSVEQAHVATTQSFVLSDNKAALVLCSRASHCGQIVAAKKGDKWALEVDQLVNSPVRLPAWSPLATSGSVLSHLRFVSEVAAKTTSSSMDLSLSVPVPLRKELAASRLFATDSGNLLLSSNGGVLTLLSPLSVRQYSMDEMVQWARDESLASVRQAFLLSTSPVLAAETDHLTAPEPSQSWGEWIRSTLEGSAHAEHQHGMAALVSHASLDHGPISWHKLHLHIRGVSVSGGAAEDWLVAPALPAAIAEVSVRRVASSPMHWQPHSAADMEDANNNALLVVVDTEQHGALVWIVDAKEGLAFSSLRYDETSHQHWAATQVTWIGSLRFNAVLPTATLAHAGEFVYAASSRSEGKTPNFHLVFRHVEHGVMIFMPKSTPIGTAEKNAFVHVVDTVNGVLEVRKVSSAACSGGIDSAVFACRSSLEVAQVLLGEEADSAMVVTARAHANDLTNSPVSVLGDDNLLRKYLNPNLLLACAVSKKGSMGVHVVDVVSGRIIRRFSVEAAAGPVRALLLENYVVVSYWNPKAKRQELLVSALYEGVIGKTELTPGWKAAPRVLGLDNSEVVDSRSGFAQPQLLSVEKTFIIPRAVAHLQQTVSSKGISHKNLLMALDSGEVYSVDLRQVHPRRPLSEPTQAEKDEGLHRYNPFLALNPVQALTAASPLVGSGALQAMTAPSLLESSCTILLFSVGGSRAVRILNHVPSQGFDTLAEDFNHVLLLLLLGGLAAATLLMRMFHTRNTLRRLWL